MLIIGIIYNKQYYFKNISDYKKVFLIKIEINYIYTLYLIY